MLLRSYGFRLFAICFALALTSAPALARRDDAPAWLRQAAAIAGVPGGRSDAPAVVLHNEQRVTIAPDGRITTTTFHAVRILTTDGRSAAVASEMYLTDTGRVRDLRAWLIRPSGQVIRYGGSETLDLALVNNDIYNEVRVKRIVAENDAEVGAVFGYEVTSEDRSVFTQFIWEFQERLPVHVSRYSLTLPQGWHAAGITFNHAPVEPSVSGSTYAWELRNLPFIIDEPASPSVTNLAPRLAVSYYAPAGTSAPSRTYSDWADVARWLAELSEPQATLNDALVAKARELTAGARTELERIQAIARYTQSIHYISIQTGIGRGGGYRPRAATEVFAKSYGDCKDKANLMRAMLRAIGIESYLLVIYAGDPTYVRAEWPSPQQFNHCIIAVKISDDTQAPAVALHPRMGRFLIFDPTDVHTPVGDLPDHQQGSLALLVAREEGALLRMPVTPPEANRLERMTEASLAADGSITAQVNERLTGQSAASARRLHRTLSRPDFTRIIERWITRGATGARLSRIEPADHSAEGRFTLDVEFTAPGYGQLMMNRLLVFKPAVVSRRESLLLDAATRAHPIVLRPQAYTERARIKLPADFDVDEMPDPVNLDTPFGTYAVTYEVRDGHLHFSRSLVVRNITLPPDQYAAVRGFFERVRNAEQAPVVLTRR